MSDELPACAIELALWLAWKGHVRQAHKGCIADDIPGFTSSELRKACETRLVGVGPNRGEQKYYATKPAVRSIVKWLQEGVDPLGRSMAPYWSGRLRRKYGIGPDDDLEQAMRNVIQ